MSRKIILVDTMNALYRAHFTHKHLSSETGFPTGALHGVLTMAGHIRRKIPEAAIVFCYDSAKARTHGWRCELYPEYKANRKQGDDKRLVSQQVPVLSRLLSTLGYTQVRVTTVECDDIIGIASNALADSVFILSTDEDFYQLISRRVRVLKPAKGEFHEIGPEEVVKAHGIPPAQWLDYRALTGDSTDNLPGVRGVGPKIARLMLENGANPSLPYESQPAFVRSRVSPESWLLAIVTRQASYISRGAEEPMFPQAVRYRLGAMVVALVRALNSKPDISINTFIRLAGSLDLAWAVNNRHLLSA